MTALVEAVWKRACARSDLAEGDLREVTLPDGGLVLLIGTADRVFACAADCPHQDSPLCDATVEGTVLTCPLHFWQWDLLDGSPLGIAELPLPVFEVREANGEILVRVEE